MTGTDERRRIAAVPGHRASPSRLARAAIAAATALTILGASLVLLLHPAYIHPALDAARSSEWLGLSSVEAHRLSDMTVSELVFGPGTFAFAAPGGSSPFYDRSEASHLADARLVLLVFLGVVAASVVWLGASLTRGRREPAVWRAVAHGAAALTVGTVVVGVVGIVAFDAAFELFHRLAFPGGNYRFDTERQRLVQLYPTAFWQLTSAALGGLSLVAASVTWLVARRRAARLEMGAPRGRSVSTSDAVEMDAGGTRSEPVRP